MHDLLNEPLIRARIGGATTRLSLPEVFAAMVADSVEAFPALRPHQRHGWHMFLAQIGALALHHAGLDTPLADSESWAKLLRALAPEHGDAPWTLVVEDVSKPAFLQPPAPEGGLDGFRNVVATPDALDVLITAKNFDIKSAVAGDAAPEDWLFALLTLQTMEGFLGAGNYGIARMNGGFSARPFLGLAPEGGPGTHLVRDIRAMLATRSRLLDDYPAYPVDDGLALVWLAPWDGGASLAIGDLDPWFIEICRRVRLVADASGKLSAGTAGTKVARIQAKELNGDTGDFWAPVNVAEGKAFSLDARGFSSRVLTRILFGEGGRSDFRLPPAMERIGGETAMRLVARGVTRGQGKTEGLHEQIVPFRGPTLVALFSPDGRERLGGIAETQQKEVGQIASALRFACAVVSSGGGAEKPSRDDYARTLPYLSRLDRTAEAGFFAALQDRFEAGPAEDARAKAPYLRELFKTARALLDEAGTAIPCASINRPRARAMADRAFYGTLWSARGALANDRDLIMEMPDAA